MKVLLIQPPLKDYYFTPARMEPLGLFYLAQGLEDLPGVEVDLWDAAAGSVKPIQRPEIFSYLDEYFPPDTSVLALPRGFKRLGASGDKVLRTLHEKNPDLVVLTSNFSAYHPDVEALVHSIKTSLPGLRIILGGWAVNCEGDYWAQRTGADFLIAGEAPIQSFRALVQDLSQGGRGADLPGVWNREHRSWGPRPGPEGLPEVPPRRWGSYTFQGRPSARVVLSRGCPRRCGFCAVPRFESHRSRSLDSLKQELTTLAQQGIRVVNFEDDHLLADPRWCEDFFPLLLDFHRTWGMEWRAMNGISALDLEPWTEKALEAGFGEFNLSLVTTQTRGLQVVQRHPSARAVQAIAEKTQARIPTLVFLIGGVPGSAPEGLMQDLKFLKDLPVTIGFSPLYLLPGVPLLEGLGLEDSTDRRLCRTTALYRFPAPWDRQKVYSFWKVVRGLNLMKDQAEEVRNTLARAWSQGRWEWKDSQGAWHPGPEISGLSVKDLEGLGLL